jgi:TolB-like protein/AraC-like DNA-binding protein/Tfp pilus assembly protein PilF
MITSNKVLVEKLDRLIDDHLDDPAFSVESICQDLGLSRSHLHRVVKEHTGLSITLYIRQRRLLKAEELLLTSELRVSEIGDRVGITNPQNFSTYFVEKFKQSPTEFRKGRGQLTAALAEPAPQQIIEMEPPLHPEPVPDQQVRVPGLWSRHGWRWVLGLVGVLLVGTLAVYSNLARWMPTNSSAGPVMRSLAVLPFTNLGTADNALACEGIMDEVHTSVSFIKNLQVISRASSDQYRSSSKSMREIAGELRVENILKGSVLRVSDQIQIKVELIAAQDNSPVWTKKYSAAYKDIFGLTDQIVSDVARQLNLGTDALASGKVPSARTQNIEAYNAFLQGRQLMNTRTKADLLESLARFDQAIALDSAFAEAYAFKAAATYLLPTAGAADAKENNKLTEQIALNAIRLDPTSSTAYAVLGSLYHGTYQWQASENAFRIALQHNPNDAQANYWYSLLLRSVGRVDEAVDYSTRAVTLDPLYPVLFAGHILNCVYANRYDLAKKNIESGRRLFDNSFAYHLARAYYQMHQANYGEAISELNRAMVLNPDDKGHIPVLMFCEARRGNRIKATAFLHQLTDTSPWANYQRAVVYAGLNEADSTLYYLKKAADEGYYSRDTRVNQVFRPYHSSLTFRAVLRRYNLFE